MVVASFCVHRQVSQFCVFFVFYLFPILFYFLISYLYNDFTYSYQRFVKNHWFKEPRPHIQCGGRGCVCIHVLTWFAETWDTYNFSTVNWWFGSFLKFLFRQMMYFSDIYFPKSCLFLIIFIICHSFSIVLAEWLFPHIHPRTHTPVFPVSFSVFFLLAHSSHP